VKVRLANDEIRIRLAQADVVALIDGGVVDCVVMPGRYAVRLTTSAHQQSEVSFASNGIDVTIPPTSNVDHPSSGYEIRSLPQ
jgi:hypothetical protein